MTCISKRKSYATYENAAAIRNRAKLAAWHLREAESELKDALELAKDDYDHNADLLQHLVGSVAVIASVVGSEHSRWEGYADARKRTAEQQ